MLGGKSLDIFERVVGGPALNRFWCLHYFDFPIASTTSDGPDLTPPRNKCCKVKRELANLGFFSSQVGPAHVRHSLLVPAAGPQDLKTNTHPHGGPF